LLNQTVEQIDGNAVFTRRSFGHRFVNAFVVSVVARNNIEAIGICRQKTAGAGILFRQAFIDQLGVTGGNSRARF